MAALRGHADTLCDRRAGRCWWDDPSSFRRPVTKATAWPGSLRGSETPGFSPPGRGRWRAPGAARSSRKPATATPGGEGREAARDEGDGQQVDALGDAVAEVDARRPAAGCPAAAAPARWSAAVTRCAVQVRSASSTGTSAPSAGSGRSSDAQQGHLGQQPGGQRDDEGGPGRRRRAARRRDQRTTAATSSAAATTRIVQTSQPEISSAWRGRRGGTAVFQRGPRPGGLGEQDAGQQADRRAPGPTGTPTPRPNSEHAADHAGEPEQEAEPPDPPSVLRLALQRRACPRASARPARRSRPATARRPGGQPPRPRQQDAGHEHGDEQDDGDEATHGAIVASASPARPVRSPRAERSPRASYLPGAEDCARRVGGQARAELLELRRR